MPKIAAWAIAVGLSILYLGMIIMVFDTTKFQIARPKVVEIPSA